jgi:hypothetical protein
VSKKRLTPSEVVDKRRADGRGCNGSYRAERRNQARRMGYVWRALPRQLLTDGRIVVKF